MNAYTAAEVGGEVVEEHTEESLGHEEVYVVVAGHATFTLDGEEVDAPAGTIVHLPEPKVKRTAVALEPGTTVLAVGAKRGEAFTPSGWEVSFRANQLPPDEAVRLIEEYVAGAPRRSGAFYNLACFRMRAGDREGALDAFRRAFELDPDRVRKWSARRRGPRPDPGRGLSDHRVGARPSRAAPGTGSASGRATSSTAP